MRKTRSFMILITRQFTQPYVICQLASVLEYRSVAVIASCGRTIWQGYSDFYFGCVLLFFSFKQLTLGAELLWTCAVLPMSVYINTSISADMFPNTVMFCFLALVLSSKQSVCTIISQTDGRIYFTGH